MKNTGLNTIPSVRGQVLNLTLNLVLIAVFYVFFGAFVSYWMSRIFPPFNPEWEQLPNAYQLLDVAVEISVLVLAAFWLTYLVHVYIPIFKVSPGLEGYIESFGGQMVFVYAVFIFMDTLDDKLKHVFQDFFG